MVLPLHTSTPTDDIQLLKAVAQQDQAAFLQLYHRYSNLVYSLALRVLRHPTVAEEVTQDVFLKIWQQPFRWNPALGQFSSWLLTITRNAAIDRLRKEQRSPQSEIDLPTDLVTLAVTERAISDDPLWFEGQILRTLLQQLPDEQRQLIELAFYQGYTHSELAEGLAMPLGTVKTRLRSGLQRLRTLWEEAHPAPLS